MYSFAALQICSIWRFQRPDGHSIKALKTVRHQPKIQSLSHIFTAWHGMPVRTSYTRKVSARLSVKRVICDKTKESCTHILIPYNRSFTLVQWQEEWLVGVTPSTWNFGSSWPRWCEIADFQSIFARSASAVAPSKRSSINTNRKSKTRFPMSLRWTSYVDPKPLKKGSKTQNGRFPTKIALCLKKVSLCENCQRQSCKAFIGLSNSAKIIGGERPIVCANLADTDPPLAKRRFSINFRL